MQFEFKPTIGISAREIDRLGLDIRSFREPLKRAVQQVMSPSFKENFERGGRPEAWEPLSDATLAIRDIAGIGGDQPLVRTGLLRKTISQLNIWTITETTATIRALPDKIKYGTIHQGGFAGSGSGGKMTSYLKKAKGDPKEAQKLLDDDLIMSMRSGQRMTGGKRTVAAIPQRIFVNIQEEDYDKIEDIFVRWLQERMARRGFGIAEVPL
jgi:phage gpG-like protein